MASMYDTLLQQRYGANGPQPLSPAERQTFWHLDGFPHYQSAPATSDPTSQSGLPPGFSQMLDKLSGGGKATNGGAIMNAQPNTAGGVPTDSGSFGSGIGGADGFGGLNAPLDYSSQIGGADGVGGLNAPLGGAADAGGGSSTLGGAGGFGGLASLAPFGYAAAIGVGANTAANHGGTPLGDGLTSLLGPSAAQMWKDPMGMGLPTLLGAPWLTPFTGSDEAKKTKPEWSGLFGLGF